MRIALLSHQWPGARMGGIGSAVRNTAAALAQAGHDVHVFTLTLPGDACSNVPTAVHLHQTPTLAERVNAGTLPAELTATLNAGGEGVYRLGIAWLLCDALLAEHRQQPFDIVETPEVEALALPLLLKPDFTAPVVAHLHCATAIAHLGNQAPVTASDALVQAMEFATIALASAVCAPTQKVVELTRHFMRIDTPPAIIPHPVAGAPVRQADDASAGPIVFFGRVERLKGVETIAKALNRFLPRNPTATFRYIGPDTNTAPARRSMVQHLRSLIEAPLLAQVEFAGEMNQQELQQALRASSFCVLPSLWENFSMAVCEAMAAGRAVIVGEGTGSPEVVADAGVVSRRDDADDLAHHMERLHRSPELRSTLSRRALRRVQGDLAPTRIAGQRVAFYEETLARGRDIRRRSIAEALTALPPLSQAALLEGIVAVTGSLTRVASGASRTPGSRLLAIMEHIARSARSPACVVLYGAGKHTQRLLSERALWETGGHRVVGILDDHPRFAENPTFLDLPVRSVAAAARAIEQGESHPPIVLSTDTYQDQFFAQTAPLQAHGIPVHRLYE